MNNTAPLQISPEQLQNLSQKAHVPLISVVMSTYNRADSFLSKSIVSVLSQTNKDFELIIVDDHSTDNTAQVVAQFSKDDPRIVYYPLPTNHGSDTKPKNWGIAISRGKYIAYIDDDVEWTSYHLEILLKAFEENPTLDVAFCESLLYKDGKMVGKAICQCVIPNGEKGFNKQFLLNRNYIDTSQVMHKKELGIAVGGFDEQLPKFIDWNMWVRMAKWGATFQHVPIPAVYYHIHEGTKSERIKTKSWFDENLGMSMFEPTFNPSGCYIHLPYLGMIDAMYRRQNEVAPTVAIFTITYDRLDYTKRMYDSLHKSTNVPFDWLVFDNGSSDNTVEFVKKHTPYYSGSSENKGLSFASNYLLDKAEKRGYNIIVKVDNDCEFKTKGWLEDLIDLWKRNHMLYMSPYVEGLIDNPGGAPRVGQSYIGPYYVEVTQHIGGICAFIDARAYKTFRFKDEFLHGNQDREASIAFTKMGYMPMYLPIHRIMHMDSTNKQKEKYPEYFKRRVKEKQTKVSLQA